MKHFRLFKFISIFLLLVTYSYNIKAQCSADAGADITICNGNYVKIGKSQTAYTYSWSPSSSLSSPNDSTPFAFPIVNTTYTLTIDDGAGCTATDDIAVTVIDNPTVTVSPDINIAFGTQDTIFATAAGTLAPYSYEWSPTSGLMTPDNDSTIVIPPDTMVYTVTVTDANGCTNTGSVWVSVFNATLYPIANAGPDTVVCQGVPTVIGKPFGATGSGGSAPYTYFWWPSTGLDANDIANPTATPNTDIVYRVTVTDANGLIATDRMKFEVKPTPTADAGPDFTLCNGINRLGGFPAGWGGTTKWKDPLDYLWTPNTSLSSDTATNPSVYSSLVNTTTYILRVTDNNGCYDQDTAVVRPLVKITTSNFHTICEGNAVAMTVTVTPNTGTPPYTYIWDNAGTLDDASISNPQASPTTSTTYTVTVKDASNCSTLAFVIVDVENAIITNTGANKCEVDTSEASVLTLIGQAGAISYSWETGELVQSISVKPQVSTIYKGTITYASGCISTAQASININDSTPNAGFSVVNDRTCAGDNDVDFTVNVANDPSVTYYWDFGDGSTAAGNNVSHKYDVIYSSDSSAVKMPVLLISNFAGCTDSSIVDVSLLPRPSPDSITVQDIRADNYVCAVIVEEPVSSGNYVYRIFLNNNSPVGSTALYDIDWGVPPIQTDLPSQSRYYYDFTSIGPLGTDISITSKHVYVADGQSCESTTEINNVYIEAAPGNPRQALPMWQNMTDVNGCAPFEHQGRLATMYFPGFTGTLLLSPATVYQMFIDDEYERDLTPAEIPAVVEGIGNVYVGDNVKNTFEEPKGCNINAVLPAPYGFNPYDAGYKIDIKLTNACGTYRLGVDINVFEMPQIDYTITSTPNCYSPAGVAINFQNLTTKAECYYNKTLNFRWWFGDGSAIVSSSSDNLYPYVALPPAIHNYMPPGAYMVNMGAFYTSTQVPPACRDTMYKQETVQILKVNAALRADTVCFGMPTTITDSTTYLPEYYVDMSIDETTGDTIIDTLAKHMPYSWKYTITDTSSGAVVYNNTFYHNRVGFPNYNPYFTFGTLLPTYGIFKIRLEVTDEYGCVDSTFRYIYVDTLPGPDFVADTVCLHSITNFANISSDLIPGANDSLSYWWDFGDGTPISTMMNPTHRYSDGGAYSVVLQTRNNRTGCIYDTVKLVFVNHVDIDILGENNCFGAQTRLEGMVYLYNYYFMDSVNAFPKYLPDVNPNALYNYNMQTDAAPPVDTMLVDVYTWEWKFGDGNSALSYKDSVFWNQYADSGWYYVKLKIMDTHGCSDSAVKPIYIIPLPDAQFVYDTLCFGAGPTHFTDSSQSLSSPPYPIEYRWDFGDAVTSDLQNPDHTYSSPGNFWVKLFVIDSAGCWANDSLPIILNKPKAYYLRDTACFAAGVNFIDSSYARAQIGGAPIVSWKWHFGDSSNQIIHRWYLVANYDTLYHIQDSAGTLKTIASDTIHVSYDTVSITEIVLGSDTFPIDSLLAKYPDMNTNSIRYNFDYLYGDSAWLKNNGEFFVKLHVTDAAGCVDSTRRLVVVNKPVPKFYYDTVCYHPLGLTDTISFRDYSTVGVNCGGSSLDTAFWYFGDGNDSIIPYTSNDTIPPRATIKYRYATPGNYKVTLVVKDSTGCTDSIQHYITINGPIAKFNFDTVCFGDTIMFTDSSSMSATVNGARLYKWDWTWGDGNSTSFLDTFPVNPLTVTKDTVILYSFMNRDTLFTADTIFKRADTSHYYTTAGRFGVQLIVTDVFGCKDTIKDTVIVNKPTVDFSWVPVCLGSTIDFNDTVRPVVPQGAAITTWAWNMDTVNNASVFPPLTIHSNDSLLHRYDTAGRYYVQLIVEDEIGCRDTMVHPVVINKPVAILTASGPCKGVPTNFVSTSTTIFNDPLGAPLDSMIWHFGDSTVGVPAGNPDSIVHHFAYQDTTTHLYEMEGTYDVYLIIKDTLGCADTTQITIGVNMPVPDFTFDTVCVGDTTRFGDRSVSVVPLPAGAPVIEWTWTFYDTLPGGIPISTNYAGLPATSDTAKHRFNTAGRKMVVLTAWDNLTCHKNDTDYVIVNGPVADFTYHDTCLNFTNSFTDVSFKGVEQSRGFHQRVWNFDYGVHVPVTQDTLFVKDSDVDTTYTYPIDTAYRVLLTVIDSAGCIDTATQIVRINQPVAGFTFNNPCKDKTVLFTETSASGWTGGALPDLSLREWIHTDTAGISHRYLAGDPSATSFAFAVTGLHPDTLIITDVKGCKDTIVQTIIVDHPNPGFTFDTVCLNSPSNFTDTSTTFVPLVDGGAPLVSWIWKYDSILGAAAEKTMKAVTVPPAANGDGIYTFNTPGQKSVWLILTDSKGCKDSIAQTVIVNKPVADFTLNDTCWNYPHSFTDASLPFMLVGANITEWIWRYGDAQGDSTGTVGGNSPTQTHTYDTTGNYNVTLIVYDDNPTGACSDTIVKPIKVNKPIAAFTFDTICFDPIDTTSLFAGTAIESVGGPAITLWKWNFDTLTGSADNGEVIRVTANTTYKYTSAGNKYVKLKVQDIMGCLDSIYHPIIVNKPKAQFTFDTVCAIDTTTFNAYDSIWAVGGKNIDRWVWDFGDGTTVTAYNKDTTHIFDVTAAYNFSVKLTVYDQMNCVDSIRHDVFVNKPIADFTTTASCKKTNATFIADSLGSINATGGSPIEYWVWDYGDGDTDSLGIKSTSHLYNNDVNIANYNAILKVYDEMGCWDTISKPIIVNQPIAVFTFDTVCFGSSTNFTGTDSIMATGGRHIKDWQWWFDSPNANPNDIAQNRITSYTYLAPQNYDVRLVVIDSVNCSDTLIRTVFVNKPVPLFSFDTVCAFDTTSLWSTDSISIIGGAPATQWQWEFDDGDAYTADNKDTIHIFDVASSYNYSVKLTVVDSMGCMDSVRHDIFVNKPIADFTPTTSCKYQNANFIADSLGSINATGGSPIEFWVWTYGDGDTDSLGIKSTSHLYNNDILGNYNASLKVYDQMGCWDTISKPIIVNSPVAMFTFDTVCFGSTTHFTGTDSIIAFGGRHIQEWNWRFDHPNVAPNDQGNQNRITSVIYASPINYNVRLIVIDSATCQDTLIRTVFVNKPVPLFAFDTVCALDTTSFWSTDSISIIGGSPADKWIWKFGDATTQTAYQKDTIHIYNPVATYNYTVELVVVDTMGCKDSISHPIFVNKPIANFTNTTNCKESPTEFDADSADAVNRSIHATGGSDIVQWAWTYCDTCTTDTFGIKTAQYIYPAGGNYTALLTVIDAMGCWDTTSNPIIVNKPTAAFQTIGGCLGVTADICDTSRVYAIGGAALSSRLWNIDFDSNYVYGAPQNLGAAGGDITVRNPLYIYDNFGPLLPYDNCAPLTQCFITQSYFAFGNDKLIVDLDSIYLEAGDTLFIYDGPIVSGVPAKTYLPGTKIVKPNASLYYTSTQSSVTFRFSRSGTFVQFGWAGTISRDIIKTDSCVNYLYKEPGVYNIRLIETDAMGCSDTIVNTLNVDSLPIVQYTIDTVCLGDSTTFTNTSRGANGKTISSVLWKYGDGNTSNNLNASFKYKYADDSTYWRSVLILTDNGGCVDSSVVNVKVRPLPIPLYSASDVCLFDSTHFVDLSSIKATGGNIKTWGWTFESGQTSALQNPAYLYPSSGDFVTVKLLVTDTFACKDSITDTVHIRPLPVANFTFDR